MWGLRGQRPHLSVCDAKLDKAQIHDLVLVGGSTRIPKVSPVRLG